MLTIDTLNVMLAVSEEGMIEEMIIALLASPQLAIFFEKFPRLKTAITDDLPRWRDTFKGRLKGAPVPPELEEEVSLEELKKQYEEKNRIIQDFNQQIGQKQNLLDENRKNEERLRKEKEIEEQLELDYQKWKRLCFYFGDEKGKTFRNIAQSFIEIAYWCI